MYGQLKPPTPTTTTTSPAASGDLQGHAPIAILPPGGPTFDSLDLMLMHHFCTSTATSLSSSLAAQEVWRNVVPTYAYKHHMLMHGVLTLSAHHYVHTCKSSVDAVTLNNYRTRALYHQQLGLQLFRQQVQHPSGDQSHEILLVFAAVVGMLTFADADLEQQTLSFDDALNILAVIRGKQALWRSGSGLPTTSDMAPAFFDPPAPEHRMDLGSTAFALSELHDAIEDDIRRNAIAILKGVAESQTNSEFRMLGTWPAAVSEDFLHLLRLKDDIALQAFEHYCTILDSMRRLWWIGDFGRKLRAAIGHVRSMGGTPITSGATADS